MQGKNVLLIASASWDSPTKVNVHFVAEHLAKDGNRVLFIESLGLREPKMAKADIRKILKRIIGFAKGPRQPIKNVYVLSPLPLPFQRFGLFRKLNTLWLLVHIRCIQIVLSFKKPILWLFLPTGNFLIGKVQEVFRIYHCVDDYAANPGVDGARIRHLEADVVAQVDLILTTAALLYERFKPLHHHVAYVPNVANYALFSMAQDEKTEVPEHISALSKPILGYWGNLADYKIDWGLLAAVAQARPDWMFCLIGPEGLGDPGTDLEKIKVLSNIFFAGAVPYEQLPKYAKGFDVCILPSNTQLAGSFPMKFYEYLATGKPVIATSQPSIVKEYEGKTAPCLFADTPEEFAKAVEDVLNNPAYNIEYRLSEAHTHSWEKRMEDIYGLVRDTMTE